MGWTVTTRKIGPVCLFWKFRQHLPPEIAEPIEEFHQFVQSLPEKSLGAFEDYKTSLLKRRRKRVVLLGENGQLACLGKGKSTFLNYLLRVSFCEDRYLERLQQFQLDLKNKPPR